VHKNGFRQEAVSRNVCKRPSFTFSPADAQSATCKKLVEGNFSAINGRSSRYARYQSQKQVGPT
jgi:hypothetical protein